MDPLLATLILIVVALLGARFSFSTARAPAGPRLMFRTGTHFLLIGFALGPAGLGLLSEEATTQLSPFLALGLGWVGFHFGLQLDRHSLFHFPWTYHALALTQAIVTLAVVFGAGLLVTGWIGFDPAIGGLLAAGAACAASISTPAAIAMVSSNFMVKGQTRDLLFFVASVDAVVGIVALQVTYSVFRPVTLAAGLPVSPELFLVPIAAGLGIVCGIVFLWLVRARPAGEELVLFLLGICAFAAGAALQWGLSPLFVSVTMGAVVANFAKARARVLKVLSRWEKPVYVTFLLLGGALIQLPAWWIVPAAVGYAVLRAAGKSMGTALAVSILPLPEPVPKRLGLGLVPQGGISIAMAVSGVLVYSELQVAGHQAETMLFGIILIGVTLSELVGPLLTIRVLRRSGEISPEVLQAIQDGDEKRAQREAVRHAGGETATDGGH